MKNINMYILLFCLCLLILVAPVGVSAVEPSTGSILIGDGSSDHMISNDEFRYYTDEGLQIVSYVDIWQEDRLSQVAEELKRNTHGLEMEYLDRVEIHVGVEPGGKEQVSASYEREQQQITVPIYLPGFLPVDYQIKVPVEKGVIHIYKGKEKEGVEDMALDLSHEYGHHFAFFHFDKSFSPNEYENSAYYQIRQLEQFSEVNGEASYEEEIHRWSIFEIAAEDYHQLLGSPTGKKITRFLDISQKMGNSTYRPINTASRLDFNAIPQENWSIPLASQIEGLEQYFFSFLGNRVDVAAISPASREKGYEKKASVMGMDDIQVYLKNSELISIPDQSLHVLSHREEEHYEFKKHIIEWNALILEDGEQPVYTLVALDKNDKIIPIKTVYPGEETSAVIGTVTQVIDPYVYYYQDGLDQASLDFRLYIQYPDGRVIAAKDLTVDFNTR